VLPALAGIGAPWWRSGARGVISGLTAGVRPAHVGRAALEAYRVAGGRTSSRPVRENAPVDALRVDGGLTRDALLLQLQADAAGVAVERGAVDATAAGAAALAAVGAGIWPSTASIADHVPVGERVEPRRDAEWRDDAHAEWRAFVERAAGALAPRGETLVDLTAGAPPELADDTLDVRPQFVGRIEADVPRYRLPERSMPPSTAYEIVHDELLLDGNAAPQPRHVRDHVDGAPGRCPDGRVPRQEHDRQGRVPDDGGAREPMREHPRRPLALAGRRSRHGCSTTGSSEACMLAGLALERRWRARRGADRGRPNLVMGANVQVCWEKFCRYWDVEPRLVPVSIDAP